MNYSERKMPEFVVGDLVYYVGNLNPYGFPYTNVHEKSRSKRVGIVIKINDAMHVYSVYWLKDQLASNHVANHLELVYNV